MSKITLNPLASEFDATAINDNFAKIQTALQDRVLYRSNPEGEANNLESDIDVNGRRLYNLPPPVLPTDAARLMDVGGGGSGGGPVDPNAESKLNKNTVNGYPGLTGFNLNIKNNSGSVTSVLTNTATASRIYTLKDRNGTLVDEADLSTKLAISGGRLSGAIDLASTVSVTASGTLNIGAVASNSLFVTGSAVILNLGASVSGAERTLIFQGVSTLTHNATSLKLPSSLNIVTAVDDVGQFICTGGSNWRCVNYTRASGTSLVATAAPAPTPASTTFFGRFQVQPNKTILDPQGRRFIVRGVTMFDYLFVSQEARTNYLYRSINNPNGKGEAAGISEPTYYAPYQYKSTTHVTNELQIAKNIGVNLIRVAVEPAIMKASVSYVDPSDGLTYPSDIIMLDNIVNIASGMGMVVQLQLANDMAPDSMSASLITYLIQKYYSNPYVWINPANEPLAVRNGGANVRNVSMWAEVMGPLMTAVRAAIPGVTNTKFLNPVVINPTEWGNDLAGVHSTLQSNTIWRDDPNMIIGVHAYALDGEFNFRANSLAKATTDWFSYSPFYSIIIDEVGINNFGLRYDPNLDAGFGSINLTKWAQMQSWMSDFMNWCNEKTLFSNFNGVTGHMWYAYIPGLARHDLNSMRKQDNTFSTWGDIFRGFYSSAEVRPIDYLRALGVNFSSGAWESNYIATGAIVSSKIADGAVTSPKLAFQSITADKLYLPWQDYTPSITSETGGLSNVSSSGRYIVVGNTVTFNAKAIINTNGPGASGLYISLPPVGTPVNHTALSAGSAVNGLGLFAQILAGAPSAQLRKYDGSYPGGDGAIIIVSGSYEIS